LLRLSRHSLLAGDHRQLFNSNFHQLLIGDGAVDTTVDADLLQLRRLHDAAVIEFLHKGRYNFLLVLFCQTRSVFCATHLITSPDFLAMRTNFPSSRLRVTLVAPPLLASHNRMFEIWIGASFLMIPPLVFCAEGLVCLVTIFTS